MESILEGSLGKLEEHFSEQRKSEEIQATRHPQHSSQCANGLISQNANKAAEGSENMVQGSLGGAAVWRLPLARGAILETRDRIPRRASFMGPASPSACISASVCVCVCVS